jgi:hypothetical protein
MGLAMRRHQRREGTMKSKTETERHALLVDSGTWLNLTNDLAERYRRMSKRRRKVELLQEITIVEDTLRKAAIRVAGRPVKIFSLTQKRRINRD